MAKMVKKAQSGVESPLKSRIAPKGPEFRPGQVKRMDRIFESNPDRAIKVGKRMLKRATAKAEKGGAFGMLSVKAGVDKNPNPTQADRIAGAKGLAKKGKTVAKKLKSGGTVSMQLGTYTRQIGKNYTGKATKAVGLTKAKYGVSMMKKGGKCKNGC